MPIFRRTRLLPNMVLCTVCAGCGKLHTVHTARGPTQHNHSHHNQCRTPYEVIHNLVLLKMGIMMPETCRDRSLIINTRLVASCWFLSLHPTFMMHCHKSLKLLDFSHNLSNWFSPSSYSTTFLTRSVQLILSILLQHRISRRSTYFWCTFRNVKISAPNLHLPTTKYSGQTEGPSVLKSTLLMTLRLLCNILPKKGQYSGVWA